MSRSPRTPHDARSLLWSACLALALAASACAGALTGSPSDESFDEGEDLSAFGYTPGTGLKGEYFSGRDLKSLSLTRVDPRVAFDWGYGSPAPAVSANDFSVRWTGFVRARFDERYTFYTRTDEGVRLWVDGKLLIDHWTDHALTTDQAQLDLTEERDTPITMEYYDHSGRAVAKLYWQSASQTRQLVPSSRLRPTPGASDGGVLAPDSHPAPKADGGAAAPDQKLPGPTPAPARVLGVTIDDIQAIDEVIAAVKLLPQRATVRVVFDETQPDPKYYLSAVQKLSAVADVMGELLDSAYVKSFSAAQITDRAKKYLATLGPHVAVWEVGNEVNGDWLGSGVWAKVQAAWDVFAGKKRAINFYYNKGCGAPAANEMFTWIKANVPAAVKQSLDWALFSYYEDDCDDQVHDAAYWEPVFTALGQEFPSALLGFGEVGSEVASEKQAMIQRYYGMKISHPRYVGGYFWWYFYQDRKTAPAWISAVW